MYNIANETRIPMVRFDVVVLGIFNGLAALKTILNIPLR